MIRVPTICFGDLTDRTVIKGSAPDVHVAYNASNNLQTGDTADANGNIGYGYLHDIDNRLGCDPKTLTLVAPSSKDTAGWYDRSYINIRDGKIYRLGRPGRRLPSEAEPMTLLDVISQYRWHPEAKSLAPDGTPCTARTHGLLLRAPITLGSLGYIGKETDRHLEQGEDISILNAKPVQFRPNETEQLMTADEELRSKGGNVPVRTWARAAGVSKNTVKAAMRGERLRKSTIEKLAKALEKPHS